VTATVLDFIQSEWKPILIGGLGTVLGSLLLGAFYNTFRSKAKIVGLHQVSFLNLIGPKDSTKNSVHYHQLIIQNLGRGIANKVAVKYDKEKLADFKVRREKIGWSLSVSTLISDDKNYVTDENEHSITVTFNNLGPMQRLSVEYLSIYGLIGSPKSIEADGILIDQQIRNYTFLREREIYWQALKSLWYILPFIASVVIQIILADMK
jgi:hypothetical protein